MSLISTSNQQSIAGYDVIETLGHGACSTIYAVKDPKDSQIYALKCVVRTDASCQRFIDQMVNEYEVAAQISHPLIRRCVAIRKKRHLLTVQEAYLVMELVDGQTLVQRRPQKLADLVRIFLATAQALEAMNAAGFVHADMKPNNILVNDEGEVKIIDLGQSCPLGTIKKRIQGTPDYIAPEQVRRKPLTQQTDMFNLGAAMYWCVTDHHIPTLIPDENGHREKGKFYPASHYNPEIPHPLDQLIRDCLRSRPIDRPETWESVRVKLELALLQLEKADQPPPA
jgi:eukaryotic-like serine/threonine-protein kinase